jgi:hypothetical protein
MLIKEKVRIREKAITTSKYAQPTSNVVIVERPAMTWPRKDSFRQEKKTTKKKHSKASNTVIRRRNQIAE